MQTIATRIFICASIFFGIIGLLVVVTSPGPDTPDTFVGILLAHLLFMSGFIILSSFAVSVAGKYLQSNS